MESRVKIGGHAVHPMLVVFPLGLLATAVAFDIVFLIAGIPVFSVAAFWMMTAGIIGGLIAAPFGWIDWFAIPNGTRAKRIGLLHGSGNVVVLLLFLASWLMRNYGPASPETPQPAVLALVCSFGGAVLAVVTGWLGGELVERLGVGVSDRAGLNADSSLHQRQHRHAG